MSSDNKLSHIHKKIVAINLAILIKIIVTCIIMVPFEVKQLWWALVGKAGSKCTIYWSFPTTPSDLTGTNVIVSTTRIINPMVLADFSCSYEYENECYSVPPVPMFLSFEYLVH